jgi:hypothetical protein
MPFRDSRDDQGRRTDLGTTFKSRPDKTALQLVALRSGEPWHYIPDSWRPTTYCGITILASGRGPKPAARATISIDHLRSANQDVCPICAKAIGL